MKQRSWIRIAIAAALSALAIAALPVLAGAKDHGRDDGHGEHRGEHRHHHNHGVGEREENGGKITAFDATTGKLTIAFFDGDTVTARVDRSTKIKCEGRDDRVRGVSRRDHGDDNGGSGSGHSEPGDDNGGRGEPSGDDPASRRVPSPARPATTTAGEYGVICTAAALVPGAVVQEADLELEHGVLSFDEIELAQHQLARELRGQRRGGQGEGRPVCACRYLASSQSLPTPTSTSSGGSSS